MGMRLLPKSEIDKSKSLDRQKEIDEGMKLAKRVDSLREIHAQEEASLATFRDKTLKLIQAEIEDKTSERDSLITEVRDLETRREIALRPLDVEWRDLHRYSDELVKLAEQMASEKEMLVKREEVISDIEEILEIDKERTDDDRMRVTKALQEAEKNRLDTKEELAEARNITYTETLKADLKAVELQSREASVQSREIDVKNMWDNVQRKNDEVSAREAKVADAEKMLERGFKELKNKQL